MPQKKKQKEECPNADKNPACPYLVDIITLKESVEWLKKGYNIQIVLSAATLIGILIKIFMG
jgi:hypothetical protein